LAPVIAASYGTNATSATATWPSARPTASATSREPARPRGSTSTRRQARASTSTARSSGSTRCSRQPDGSQRNLQKESGDESRALPARLAGGTLRADRRAPLLPLSQGSRRHKLVAHARLGDADGVPRPARDRRHPGDVLQAGPEIGV